RTAGTDDGEILSAFIRQFYSKNVTPAPELLLSEEVPESDLLSEWLSGLAGRRVGLVVPQRGTKRDFVAMAEANAAIALQHHLLSRSNRQQLILEDLQRSLELPTLPNRIEGYDIASLEEMLRRRFARSLEEGTVLPDLVLIDGGRGQLNVGLKVLQDLGL